MYVLLCMSVSKYICEVVDQASNGGGGRFDDIQCALCQYPTTSIKTSEVR